MIAKNNPMARLLPWVALSLAGLACSIGGVTNAGPTADPNLLFSDDFSNSSSGWDRVTTDSDYSADYDSGVYRMSVSTSNLDVWANPGKSYSDVSVTVEATKTGGPDDNDFGLICRYEDTSNFYFFIISSDGYYGIGQVKDGDQNLLSGDSMESSDSIKLGGATNIIRADCVGDSLSLYANGDKLSEVSNSDFRSGDVGLITGTFDEAGTEIAFDNFVVRKP